MDTEFTSRGSWRSTPERSFKLHPPAENSQVGLQALGRQISQLGERLALSPPEHVEATIIEGLNGIIGLVDGDRICWYEVDEEAAVLLHKYTASAGQAPFSPKVIPTGKMPFLGECLGRHEVAVVESPRDLPPEGDVDRKFLEQLGVQSLLLIPSRYSQQNKGVLGLSSYSVERRWSEETINHLANAANVIGAALQRRETQRATRESEERFKYLFAQASIGIALETMTGRILEVNPAFCSMIGYSREELLNLSCAHLGHPEDEAIEKVLFDDLCQGRRASYSMEKRFFRKDGSLMWGHVSISLLNADHEGVPHVIGMVSDITAQKLAESALLQRDKELQLLAGRLIEAQEEERARISRDLHDDIGQRVALLASEIDLACSQSLADQKERAAELLPKLHGELSAIATDIHELSHELHSASLQCCGLKVGLRDLCRKYWNNYHLEIELQAEDLDASLAPEVSLCLFRVAQEALANIQKHGQTKKAVVAVIQDGEKVRLTVKDFGVGFDLAAQSRGIGLITMRERLRFCGGVLSVKAAPNEGTEITAEVAAAKAHALTANS
jgi:PAS domain S-box-containing protein